MKNSFEGGIYHEQMKTGRIETIGLDKEKINFLFNNGEVDRETMELSYLLVKQALEKMYNIFSKDYEVARVEKYPSLEDFFSRLVIMVGAKREGKETAGYSPKGHTVVLHLDDYFDKENRILVDELYRALVHEFVHFASFRDIKDKGNTIRNYGSGYMSVSDDQMGGEIRYFEDFNEAVVDYYTFKILPDLQKLSMSVGGVNRTQIDPKESQYAKEREIFDKMMDYLASYSKRSKDQVWVMLRNGLLNGRVFGSFEFRRSLFDCFGGDFLVNFLNKMENRTVEDLDRCWQKNGFKK